MDPRESNPDQLSISLRGASAIAEAADAARTFGQSQWLAGDELARLCIVIEELVANLYDHGGLNEESEVELSFLCEPDGIRVSIVDPGAPFDPWSTPQRAERQDRGGGAGIDIVRAWANFVSYAPSPGSNRLEFLLPVHWDS